MILRTCVIRTYFSCINDQQIFNFTLPYMPLEPFYRHNTKYYLTFTKHITLFEQRNHTPPQKKIKTFLKSCTTLYMYTKSG